MFSKRHPPEIFFVGHISATIYHSEMVHHSMFGHCTGDQSFFSQKDPIQPTSPGIPTHSFIHPTVTDRIQLALPVWPGQVMLSKSNTAKPAWRVACFMLGQKGASGSGRSSSCSPVSSRCFDRENAFKTSFAEITFNQPYLYNQRSHGNG